MLYLQLWSWQNYSIILLIKSPIFASKNCYFIISTSSGFQWFFSLDVFGYITWIPMFFVPYFKQSEINWSLFWHINSMKIISGQCWRWFGILHTFHYYLSHIKMMEGWQWKAQCPELNSTPFFRFVFLFPHENMSWVYIRSCKHLVHVFKEK